MPVYELDGVFPEFADRESGWIAPDASVIGKVKLGRDVGIWFGAVLRGDNEPITIGDGTNLQEHVMVHTDPGFPVTIGESCTIGHRAIIHGCRIGNNSLIGMGAIILNGAMIGNNCLVGAGALVTENKSFPDGSLIIGSPARAVRELDPETIEGIKRSAARYVRNAQRFRAGLKPV
ncbi:gamma carbonic anhydrase family protein [Chelativorans composti]|jgi:Carbonic anhydrases/acetyltransferases, isoleucine patch superfamily|uniref:Gamma carbonic anhydrase family protein n=1 Tax=Chelativorans composti TaxID=768533 RepID=A0ABW5DEN4_9HYPH